MDSDYSAVLGLVQLVIGIFYIVAVWKVFSKAGKPGWASLIPFYSLYILLKIGGKPGWWLVLFLIPFVNIYAYFSMSIGIAKAFNRSTLFGVAVLGFFQLIGYMIIGFGKSSYTPGTLPGSKAADTPMMSTSSDPLITPKDQSVKIG